MKRIIAALFSNDTEALAAMAQLTAAGFGPDALGLLHRADLADQSRAQEARVIAEEAGMLESATLGGLAGLVLAVTTAGLPGIGVVLAAGALAAAVNSTGQQGLEGLFWDLARRLNLNDTRTRDLLDEIGEGGALVTVEAVPTDALRAAALLRAGNAREIFDFEPDENQPGQPALP